MSGWSGLRSLHMPGSAHEIATKSIIKHIGLIAQFTNCVFCISNAKKPADFAGFSQRDGVEAVDCRNAVEL